MVAQYLFTTDNYSNQFVYRVEDLISSIALHGYLEPLQSILSKQNDPNLVVKVNGFHHFFMFSFLYHYYYVDQQLPIEKEVKTLFQRSSRYLSNIDLLYRMGLRPDKRALISSYTKGRFSVAYYQTEKWDSDGDSETFFVDSYIDCPTMMAYLHKKKGIDFSRFLVFAAMNGQLTILKYYYEQPLLSAYYIYSCSDDDQRKDGGIVVIDNKYRDNHPIVLEDVLFGKDISVGVNSKFECKEQSIDLQWSLDTHSSISSTPLIADLFGDGKKYIVLVNSNSYVEVLSGRTGEMAIGWPFISPDSTFASSPLLFDIDGDGKNEVVVSTREGEILFIGRDGFPLLNNTLKIPPLKVLKDWYEGISGKHVDSAFSLHDLDNIKNSNKKEDDDIFDESKYKLNINLLQDKEDLLYSKQYDDYIRMNKRYSNKSMDHVWVDGHILSTPVITDIDLDGHYELIVSVSYYFDHEYYSDPIHRSKIDRDVQLDKYVAGGIVCFDLDKLQIKWQTHFDLTVDFKAFSGYVYNTPTVIDVNGDSMLETVIGTSIGYVYVLDVRGKPITSLTLPLDSIYSQVVVEDLNKDGNVEIIVADSNGNLVCFSNTGDELWENRFAGMTESHVSIGDINGDGILDVVLGSMSGAIYAWSGDSGKELVDFPIKTKSLVLSPLLLVDLSLDIDLNGRNGLSIITHTSDGVLFSIDGKQSCANKLDIGDSSVSMVLADDLLGDGKINLLVTTYYGNIYIFTTNSPYHPLKAQQSFNKGLNVFTSGSQGVVIVKQPGQPETMDILGSEFSIDVMIVDTQFNESIGNSYKLSVYFANRLISVSNYHTPGLKQLTMPTPGRAYPNLLRVELTNKFGQGYQDTVSYSFNLYFARTIKWVIIIPFVLSSILIYLNTKNNNIQSTDNNNNNSRIY
ncbi:hypothetical protein DFA_07766 [Cavenderia fasciculata]|uniref:DEX1 C-terminal domain-containing protein n=1 Tax=Cavenderia fasciculata TaxID=261658 RepID=F4Q366_CACFS|nr:uncharacterized protein DFA_07766 [Cavenderia fasciculata]EGG16788.1 hypothetical protein DFA_07766 [Cavenderia fasciculata]|eukprot:XP_004355262.1 hypothetical protein DFA_07766 [Cavenderia fasciculata]